jgi:HPt (histidine-containing phosphotransfer) domain-containing protein
MTINDLHAAMTDDQDGAPRVAPREDDQGDPRLEDRIIAGLRTIYADDPAGLKSVLASFEKDARARLGHIRRAAESGDFEAIHVPAHSVTGSAAMVGAARLSSLSAVLQSCARASDADGVRQAIRRLEQELPLSLAELRRLTV